LLLALVGTHVYVFLDEDGGEEKTVRGEEVNSRVKKNNNYKVYKFVIWEVKYEELLEMNYFFICHIFCQVAKLHVLPTKFWQTLGDALMLPFY